jgi:hypothetical protein
MRTLAALAAIFCFLLLSACGGSSSNNPNSISYIKVFCNPTTVSSSQTSQCTWTSDCQGKACYQAPTYSASAGTINEAGLFTAPQTDTTLLVTITAVYGGAPPPLTSTTVVTVNP